MPCSLHCAAPIMDSLKEKGGFLEDFAKILEQQSVYTQRSIAKDIAYFYTQYFAPDAKGNQSRIAGLPLTKEEQYEIDYKLEQQPNISRREVLEAEIKEEITSLYNKVQLNPAVFSIKGFPKEFLEAFEQEKAQSLTTTISRVLKELDNGIIRGVGAASMINNINRILDSRAKALKQMVEAKCRQLSQYLLLYQYSEMGYEQYLFVTEGSNCEDCDLLQGKIFAIQQAVLGKTLPPMHPNCDCGIAILDKNGNVVAVLYNQKTESGSEKKVFLESLEKALKAAGLNSKIGKDLLLYGLRGDRVTAGDSQIPFVIMDDGKGNWVPEDIKKLWYSFAAANQERLQNIRSTGDFLNYITYGLLNTIADGIAEGYIQRADQTLQDPNLYNIVNWLSMGLLDQAKGTFAPEEALSLQHWLDSAGMAAVAVGLVEAFKGISSATKGIGGSVDDVVEGVIKSTIKDEGYQPPLGGGGITDIIKVGNKKITFGHGGRHLQGTNLSITKVNQAIAKDVANIHPGTGKFYRGQINIDGISIEYTSYGVQEDMINIGTYYPKER